MKWCIYQVHMQQESLKLSGRAASRNEIKIDNILP